MDNFTVLPNFANVLNFTAILDFVKLKGVVFLGLDIAHCYN